MSVAGLQLLHVVATPKFTVLPLHGDADTTKGSCKAGTSLQLLFKMKVQFNPAAPKRG